VKTKYINMDFLTNSIKCYTIFYTLSKPVSNMVIIKFSNLFESSLESSGFMTYCGEYFEPLELK